MNEHQYVRKERSRKLSIFEFFEILQVEYLVCDLRVRLYTQKRDKEYWRKVAEGKKSTIESIAEANSLPTIFTDNDLKVDLQKRIFKPKGFPDFHYKDENQKMMQEVLDLVHYFNKDADVRAEVYGETKVGKIKFYKPFYSTVTVSFTDGTEEKVRIEDVTRIL